MTQVVDLGALHPQLANVVRPSDSSTPGLCRAMADRLRLDPLLVRVVFIVATWFGGVGVVAYAWGVLLVPRGESPPPITRLVPRFGSWSDAVQWSIVGGSAILVVAATAPFINISIIPLVLVIGLVLSRHMRREPASQAAPPTPTAQPMPAEDVLPFVDLYAPESSPLGQKETPVPEPVRRSWLACLPVVGIMAATAGVVWLINPTIAPLVGAAYVLGVAGVVVLAWGLIARTHQLPLSFLLALCLAAMAVGGLATTEVEVGLP